MDSNNLIIAGALYTAIGKKDIAAIRKYIHQDIIFISPLTQLTGKEAYLDAAKFFTTMFNALTLRTKFVSGNQVMVVYDLDCPQPIGNVATAVLISFQDDLVSKIELFFDAGPFRK